MLGPFRIVETDEEKEKILRSELLCGFVFTRKEWRRYGMGVVSTVLLAAIIGLAALFAGPYFPKGKCDHVTIFQAAKDPECSRKIFWEMMR